MPAPNVVFPNWARVALSLVFSLAGYLVAGEVVNAQLSAALSGLVLVLSSAGVVPASAAIVRNVSPTLGLLLTVAVTAAAYVINAPDLLGLDNTAQGVITALLALAGALGIVPPQAKAGPPRVG